MSPFLIVTPHTDLAEIGSAVLHASCASPAESRFKWLLTWAAVRVAMFADVSIELYIQLPLPDLGYRLDFAVAVANRQIAFEVDGLAYHGGQKEFGRDRKRDRDVAAAGIQTFRFTALEVEHNSERVISEVECILWRCLPESAAA